MQHRASQEGQPRRTFLAGLLAGASAAAALLAAPRRARAARQTPTISARGPILYRRTAEAERYYRTLYYR
ncbi:MAG: hypothetical protein KatS3mg131_0556 [Candidatus Tectimicrobiota bacterium]|nr:MAG: hypothetical protein KatS3mg131_0556 [Candidatus Tectomicrobia bacterium]